MAHAPSSSRPTSTQPRPRRSSERPWARWCAEPPREDDYTSIAGIRARAAALADQLDARGWATQDELRAFWPGGGEIPKGAWALSYASYGRLMGRAQALQELRDPATARGPAFQRALTLSLGAVPEPVECSDGEIRYVHPKGEHALEWCCALDAAVFCINERRGLTDDPTVLVEGPLGRSLAVRLFLWIITTEGAGIPFADDATDPQPPEWTLHYTPEDLYAFVAAHHRVHGGRLALMQRAYPEQPGSGWCSASRGCGTGH